MGLEAKTPKRFKLTTDSRHLFAVAPNVLDRNFDVGYPKQGLYGRYQLRVDL